MNSSKQKELLLMLHSRFFSQYLERTSQAEAKGWFSQKEQLKDACWSGLTPELLPECFDSRYEKPAALCEINDANSFIDLVFCEYTQRKEKQFSLNPYVFMQVQGYN